MFDDAVHLGLYTAALPGSPLEQVARWAAQLGYQSLEIAAWPSWHPEEPAHLDVAGLDAAAADGWRDRLGELGLTVGAVSYYGNNLHADLGTRGKVNDHVRRCVDAAAALGVPVVGTFVGRDVTRSIEANLELAPAVLEPLVAHARAAGVRLLVENCPMSGWHPDGAPGNLAYSPELWDWVDELGLGLVFDPSHLPPLGIDPVPALRAVVHRVGHVQAKDIETFPSQRQRTGWSGPVRERSSPWDHGWWRYRVPGRGEVDWRGVVDVLDQAEYTGAVAVEHEDLVWRGAPDRVLAGLRIAHETLRPLVGAGHA